MNKIIWLYWETPPGGKRPGYVDLCRESIERYKGSWDVVVINPSNVDTYVPQLRRDFHDIPEIAHKADYIRAACLAENGGMWMDIDSVVLKPLSYITDLLAENGAVFYGWRPKQPSIGLIAAEPGHPLIVDWLREIDRTLDQSMKQKWTGVGYGLLWPLAEDAKFTMVPNSMCAPIAWQDTDVFLEDRAPSEVLHPNTVVVQLYNKGLFAKMGHLSAAEILASETLLARLFRLSQEQKPETMLTADLVSSMTDMIDARVDSKMNPGTRSGGVSDAEQRYLDAVAQIEETVMARLQAAPAGVDNGSSEAARGEAEVKGRRRRWWSA